MGEREGEGQVTQRRIEVLSAMLGLKPFVLLEMVSDADGSMKVGIDVRFGGGLDEAEAFDLMALVLEGRGWTVTDPVTPEAADGEGL